MGKDPFLYTLQHLAPWFLPAATIMVLMDAAMAIMLWRRRGERAERGDAALAFVVSPREALSFSRLLLSVTTSDVPRLVGVPAGFDQDGLWRVAAERPLAALAYTASHQPRPLTWLKHMVGQLSSGDQEAGWGAAVEAVAALDCTLCEWIKNISAMERHQRDSVAITMRDAVERYAAARR